jgi:hypothetical protein
MSVHDILEINQLNLFCKSATIEGVKVANTTDDVSYTQQLQNKNGIIALNEDIVESFSYYGSLTSNIATNYSFASTTSYLLMAFLSNSNVVQNVSNFTTVNSGSFCTGIRYTGATQQVFRIIFSVSMAGSGASPMTLNLYKNGVATTCFCTATPTSVSKSNLLYLDIVLQLSQNDNLQIYHKSDIDQTVSPLTPSFTVFSL